MKITTVAIFGHLEIKDYRIIKRIMKTILCTLIEEENAETFLFNGRGSFGYVSHWALTELKEKCYPLINRVYVKHKSEKDYGNEYFKEYDETFFPYGIKNGGYNTNINRNLIMVDMCDILLICADREDKVGIKSLVERAKATNKKIINLYEQLK